MHLRLLDKCVPAKALVNDRCTRIRVIVHTTLIADAINVAVAVAALSEMTIDDFCLLSRLLNINVILLTKFDCFLLFYFPLPCDGEIEFIERLKSPTVN